MAIITVGPLIAGIRGTTGGLTFSANKSGPYARQWSRGSNPRSSFQSAQRAALSAMPASWRDLSPAEKAAWDVWADLPAQDRVNRLGETISISGFNWFTIINTRLINIGRAVRTAVPVQARPAAPSLSSLVLPFLPQQATKVTYPSGEFLPDFDQAIEITVAISTGRTVAPPNFLMMKLDQDPPDEDNEFVVPYLNRWALAGETLKGFARLYRQTADGLRSSPGTASFISSDTAPYAATALDYDGATNFALRGADLTSNADSKVFVTSIWFRVDAGDGLLRFFATNQTQRYAIVLSATNKLALSVNGTTGTLLLNMATATSFLAGAAWHNVIIAADLENAVVQLAVDGAIETPTISTGPLDALIDWTAGNHSFGATGAGGNRSNGCVSEFYLNNAETLDITIEENLSRFVDTNGFPVDLGATAAFPTGAQPIVYFRDGDPEDNRGYGGDYVNNAALAACSTDPP